MGFASRTATRLILAAMISIAGLVAVRAESWPTKSVKIVVAFAAGGTADILARILAAGLSEKLNQQFYVENIPGSSGGLGSAQVARAAPDGYTLLIGGAGPHLVGPAVNPNIGYDTMKDFTHIAMIAGDSFMLAASNSLGVKNFTELVRIGREKEIACGSPGVGSQGHLLQVLITQATGVKLVQVPYRGANENMMDLIGNQVALALQPAISVAEQARSGNAVALAVTSAARNLMFADVPTFTELGYPGLEAIAWFWLTGPRGLPDDVVDKLNIAVREIIASPRVKDQLGKNALLTVDFDPPRVNAFLRSEVDRWGVAARAAKLEIK
jgi:tripartite-type tricarboxylate transporter receptor subunit TctC